MKTGIFPREIGRQIAEAEGIRHASDYDDFYIAVREETQELLETAEKIFGLIGEYCGNRIGKTESGIV